MKHEEVLGELRKQIDEIDQGLLPLFQKRMEVAGEVAQIKQEHNLPILDAAREQQVIDKMASKAEESFQGEVSLLMRTIFALSKSRQRKVLFSREAPLLPPAREPVTAGVICAYQGMQGAWGEQAATGLFPEAQKQAVDYFEDVFAAVKEGRAHYGIVPIENSRTGAIGENYDLLRKYGCYVVGRVGVEIRHCLLAPKGTKLCDVKEVQSHPQGLSQCQRFLQKHSWEQISCRNTAVAAQMVADANSGVCAAIGSRRAAECWGLEVLVPDIMDHANNKTYFVVIAAQPEYNKECNRVSVTFSTAHRSGALCETLMPFMAQGVNLARIESRPGTAGNYRFFADLEGNVLQPEVASALRQAASASEYFEVLGCYKNA